MEKAEHRPATTQAFGNKKIRNPLRDKSLGV
jgi:hypothetical protein